MELVQKNLLEVHRTGEMKEFQFTIEGNEVAFELISADLYSDRILAIIRELSANGQDAHTAAGKPKEQCFIHAPTLLESYFLIRDYGTGVRPEDMETLYTCLFRSTKRESNDLIGCYGVGSKSPFAYVDSFNVTTYQNGVKYCYNAFKNENNIPSCAFLGKEKTDEPDGLEVSFPVQKQDFENFENKIGEALRYFPVKPRVNLDTIKFEPCTYTVKTKDYGISVDRDTSYIIMGGCFYPLNMSDFDSTEEKFTSNVERNLINWGIHLYVPLGTVRPAASRETISYTEKARKYVKAKVTEAAASMQVEVKKLLAKSKTVWEATKLLAALNSPLMEQVFNLKHNGLQWGKHTIKTKVELGPGKMQLLSRDFYAFYNKGFFRDSRYDRQHNDGFTLSGTNVIEPVVENMTFFVHDDLKQYAMLARCKYYMEENRVTVAYIIPPEKVAELKKLGLKGKECMYILCSKLPLRPRVASTEPRQKRLKYEYYQLASSHSHGQSVYFVYTPTAVNINEKGVYVERHYSSVKLPDPWFGGLPGGERPLQDIYSAKYALDLINASESSAVSIKSIIWGVPSNDVPKLRKLGWINLKEHIEKVLRKNEDLAPAAVLRSTYEAMPKSLSLLQKLTSSDRVKEAIETIEMCSSVESNAKQRGFKALNQYAGNFYDLSPDQELVKQVKAVYDAYPLLAELLPENKGYYGDAKEEKAFYRKVAEYVRLVDSQKPKSKKLKLRKVG